MVIFEVVEGCTSPIAGACEWSEAEMNTILDGALAVGRRLAETLNAAYPGWNLTPIEAFLLVYGGSVSFLKMGGENRSYWGETFFRSGKHVVEIYGRPANFDGDVRWAVHELGHAFVNAVAGRANPVAALEGIQRLVYRFPDRPPTAPDEPTGTWGFAGRRWGWQRSDQGAASEEFADMFVGWVYNQWEPSGNGMGWSLAGQMRANYMDVMMPLWVNSAGTP